MQLKIPRMKRNTFTARISPPHTLILCICHIILAGVFVRAVDTFVKLGTQEPGQQQDAAPFESYAAICMIVKDQSDDLREFVDHHVRVGVRKFYIWDNGSRQPVVSEVRDYVDEGIVQSEVVVGRAKQVWAFEECLRRYSHRHSWMLFMDVDEYLWNKQPSLDSVLEQYNEYGMVVVTQRVVGSSGHMTRPSGGLRVNFKHCHPRGNPTSLWYKSFVNTKIVRNATWAHPHHPKFCEACYDRSRPAWVPCWPKCVDEHKRLVITYTAPSPLQPQNLTLFHYMLRSKEDFMRKLKRGAGTPHDDRDFSKDDWFFTDVNRKATIPCPELAEFARNNPVTPMRRTDVNRDIVEGAAVASA